MKQGSERKQGHGQYVTVGVIGDVMIEYLKMYYPGKRVYLVGTPDLEENFRENGILLTKNMPDVVVIGFDMTLTYEKLERASILLIL